VSLRARVTVTVTALVAATLLAGALATYVIVRERLTDDVDAKLGAIARASAAELPSEARAASPVNAEVIRRIEKIVAALAPLGSSTVQTAKQPASALGAVGYRQYVVQNGDVSPVDSALPELVSGGIAVAAGKRRPFYAEATVSGQRARVLTALAANGVAVQTALPLSEIDGPLADLRTALLIVALCGTVLAAAFSPLVTASLLRPIAALTDTAERVSRTRNLKERIRPAGPRELGPLSRAFNRMLAALEASSDAQRQLVADASHELRTPLASLSMNIELLAEGAPKLAPADRKRLVNDLREQVRELGTLTSDLVDLARDEDISGQLEDLRLDTLVREVVDRRSRQRLAHRFQVKTAPCLVRGVAQQVSRAVSNLVDNAAKWSPSAQPIEIDVADGTVLVRDHGPGIADADLPHVFERFYRSEQSRGLQGSGLGLAIVKQVAESHGGQVGATNAPGGGALLTFSLPTVP
jgi:two-component system sensor histidine kinase MprB